MKPFFETINRLIDTIEGAAILDPAADAISRVVRAVTPPGRMADSASGTPLGHPVHPPLATTAIGCVVGAGLIDLTGGDASSARRLLGAGALAALPTVYSGASDWSYTVGAERRVGAVHAAINAAGLLCVARSWWRRRHGRTPSALLMSFTGTALWSVGGWLGGHLAYAMGVGVDTTAFSPLQTEWTDVVAADDVPLDRAIQAHVSGVPLLLARDGDRIVAMADRCTHRGGPLHEGAVSDGCVTCPWHGSRFRLADGSVAAGPAVRPQPVFHTRLLDGRVQVRRSDDRSLRTNPVS